jgi:hypothetical protein
MATEHEIHLQSSDTNTKKNVAAELYHPNSFPYRGHKQIIMRRLQCTLISRMNYMGKDGKEVFIIGYSDNLYGDAP